LDGSGQAYLPQRLRGSLAVTAAAIAGDNFDLGMIREPSLECCDFAIRQQRYDPPPFEITDDRPIAMISANGPIIDADHIQWLGS
jgi:hypothetical protein